MGILYSVFGRSTPRLVGGTAIHGGESVICAPAQVPGLTRPPVDDATPSLSMYTTVSDWSWYKLEAFGIDPL